MDDINATLYRVMDVYEDISIHQSMGKWPKIGDLVKIMDRSETNPYVYAVSNGGNYGAFFHDSQLKELDDFLNIKGQKIERWRVVQM